VIAAGLADRLSTDGFCIVPDVVDAARIALLKACVESAGFARSVRGSAVYGGRNILEEPEMAALARDGRVTALVEALIGPGARVVRGIFFDKTKEANWPVAWHQDLTLAVAERRETAGWTNWSVKAGVHHVQPPAGVLARMVSLRLHLDDCGADKGPLRVLPGTHLMGRISAERIAALRGGIAEAVCVAPAGSALCFKPLLLHASSPATAPSHRRVIHLEYAPQDLLPAGMRWSATANTRADLA
jgi:ectoine hydroxylase-related dioxygenase (phytanoyl-CoA dioxygenase family)